LDNLKINNDTVQNSSYFNNNEIKSRPKEIEVSDNIKFENAFKKAKQYVQINDTKLSLSFDKENNVPIIYVLDNKTDEIIRRIPPEKLVELSEDDEKLKGLFFEKGV